VLFLSVYWAYIRSKASSVLLFPLVFLMALVGSLRTPVGAWSSPAMRDAWLLVHVTLVLLGYAALLVMAAASVLYLVHEQRLKNKRPSPFLRPASPWARWMN